MKYKNLNNSLILFILHAMIFSPVVLADVLTLVNGDQVEGKIVSVTDHEVKIDPDLGFSVSYAREEIKDIIRDEDSSLPAQKLSAGPFIKDFFGVKYDLSALNPADDYRPTNLIILVNNLFQKDIRVEGVKVLSPGDARDITVELRKSLDDRLVLFIRADLVEASPEFLLSDMNLGSKELSQGHSEKEQLQQTRREVFSTMLDGNDETRGSRFRDKIASVSANVLDNMDSSKEEASFGSEKLVKRTSYKTFDEIFSGRGASSELLNDSSAGTESLKGETLLSSGGNDSSPKEQEAILHYNKGFEHAQAGDYDLAIDEYNKAIELYPDFASAYNNRGFSYALQGQQNKALMDYAQAIEIDSEFKSAYYNRAMTYLDMGALDKAIEDYSKTIDIDPNFASAYFNRADVYIKKDDLADAIKDLTRGIELDPYFATGYYNRGFVFEDLGKKEQAIQDYEKAIELDPGLINAYLNLGNIYTTEGIIDKAMGYYNQALGIDAKNSMTYYSRANAYFVKEDFLKAVEDYSKSIDLSPQNAFVYQDRAIAYFFLKEFEKSKKDVEKAKELGFAVDTKFLDALSSKL